MLNNQVGVLGIGNIQYPVIDNGDGSYSLYQNNQPVWVLKPMPDGSGWSVYDNNLNPYGTINSDGSIIPLGSDTTDPNLTASFEPYASSFSTNVHVGDINIGGYNLQVMDDGSGKYKLYYNGNQLGYATPGQNGIWNIYNNDDAAIYSVYPNGSVVDARTNAPVQGGASFTAMQGLTPTDTGPQLWTTINTVGPDGQPYSYGLGADMTTLYDQDGNAIGKYTWDGANGFSFFNLDNSALGSFDASTGTFTSPDGQTATGSWSGYGQTIPMNAPITQTSQSTQTGTTQSGIDWSSPVAAALQDQIISSAQALPGLAEQAGVQAQDYYTNLMGRAMGQQGFQGVLNKMNQKGMLGSSLTEGALARAQQAAGQAIADKAFAASLAGTQAQMQVPGQLGNLTSQLGGTTGTTTSSNWLQNITNDPLRPYNTWGTFLNTG